MQHHGTCIISGDLIRVSRYLIPRARTAVRIRGFSSRGHDRSETRVSQSAENAESGGNATVNLKGGVYAAYNIAADQTSLAEIVDCAGEGGGRGISRIPFPLPHPPSPFSFILLKEHDIS